MSNQSQISPSTAPAADTNINYNAAAAALPERFEDEIDLMALFHLLMQRIGIILLCLSLGAGLLGLFTALFMTPMYRSTATIYIFSTGNEGATITDLQIGSQMAQDLEIIGTSQAVLQQVIDDLNLDTDYIHLRKIITVSNPVDSHMLRISAVSADPRLAADISNNLSEHLREQIADVMNTDKPSVVERATVSPTPYAPSIRRNALLGGIAGAGVAVAVIVITFLLDDTIKSKEDVMKYLELETLAELPYIKELESSTANEKKKKSRLFRMKKGSVPKTSSSSSTEGKKAAKAVTKRSK
jgi:capsular polysaccharide biosynthesis protein